MMEALRSQSNPQEKVINEGLALTQVANRQELRRGMCGRLIEVNEETVRRVNEAVKAGLDNPFRCESCTLEYDDLSFEG